MKSSSGRRAAQFSLGALITVLTLRMLKLAYQRSQIKSWLKVIVGGGEAVTVKLGPALALELPKTSLSLTGRPAEPINLILIGSAGAVAEAFAAAGWHEAVPVGASNWLRALWATLAKRSYPDGPITPFYLGTTPNDVAFQKETEAHNFQQRHHIRLWQTNLRLASGQALWLGSASFDRSVRLVRGLGMPYHHIDPDVDAERDLIASDLVAVGADRRTSYALTKPRSGRNTFHDRYTTDGRAAVVELAATSPAEAD